DSRRRRSIARLRAVVMIHPAGLGGTPDWGHRAIAIVKASWTASSATSMSPKCRTRTDTARPYSSRKTRSTSGVAEGAVSGVRLSLSLKRPHFDRQRQRPRELAPPCERGVEIGGLDHDEAADVLLAFRVRSVSRQQVAP